MVRKRERADEERQPSRLGDYALLCAILAIGALPLVGWLLRQPVARWELGLGTAVVLCAGAVLVREILGRRAPGGE